MSIGLVIAALLGFIITLTVCQLLIPYLKKIKFGQQVRDDGPRAHLAKQGTPTMGGLAFLAGILVPGVVFAIKYPDIWPLLFITFGFGAIGFTDDYLKVVQKNTKGLSPKKKLLLQFIIMAGFCIYMMGYSDFGTTILIPYFNAEWNLKWFYPFFMIVVILGTDNGVNFTDGEDGLCSSVTLVVCLFLTAASLKVGIPVAHYTIAAAGALMAFLCFNAYPAKVFMGDTGSLALGGLVAGSFVIIGEPLLILIVGFVYFAEIMSSVIQVAYFKKTHGRRIFKMAPIHHHFELCGWSETRIVTVFTIVTILLSFIGWLGL